MRKALLAALVSAMLFAPAQAGRWTPTPTVQSIPHTLYWTIFASKGDGTFEDTPFMLVGYSGGAFPTKQACQDFGEAHLPNVIRGLESVGAPAKAGKDFDVKVGCKSAGPKENA